MKNIFYSLVVLLLISTMAKAQDDIPLGYADKSLLFSQNNVYGSSRTQGLAGAGVALGGDISSGSINPAGLGLVRKGSFSITGSVGIARTNSNYFGSANSDGKLYAGLPNFGIIFSNAKDDLQEGDFRGGSFSITFTKVTNFQNRSYFSGKNPYNSIADLLALQAGNTPASAFDKEINLDSYNSLASVAYASDIIDPVYSVRGNDTLQSGYQFAYDTQNNMQSLSALTRAGIYNWDFAYGGNYKDKLYFGGAITLSRLNYYTESTYTEKITNPSNSELTQISIKSNNTTSGGGISAKAGVIYRPVDNFRLALAIQTPTWFPSLDEKYNDNFNSLLNGSDYPLTLNPGINSYALITPFKFTPAVSYFFGKIGFITAEVQFVDYTSSRLNKSVITNNYQEFNYQADNNVISNDLTSTINFKLAGEIRISNVRFRAGYAMFGDPYKGGEISPIGYFTKNTSNNDRSMYNLTAGFGLVFGDSYLDFALVNTKFNTLYSPYGAVDFTESNNKFGVNTQGNGPAPISSITNNLTTINFTIGTYFGR